MHIFTLLGLLYSPVTGLQHLTIPAWELQSTFKAGNNLEELSLPGYDSSSWYAIGSRKTVFAGLIDAGVYDDEQLFYSKNLQETVDVLPFYSPWLYRTLFALHKRDDSHFFPITNGITSGGAFYMNGYEIANRHDQAGAYGGKTYDITDVANNKNALVIKAYPTDYGKDFALGFVDWNSYPPDNGNGVWRDV